MIRNARLWSASVFGKARLKDTRMIRRLVQIGAALALHPGWSLLRCCEGDRAQEEGAYRFIENTNVSVERILESGFSSTVSMLPSEGTLVLIHDTTTLGYNHKVAEDLGPIGTNADGNTKGWLVHTSLLLTGDGHTVGLLGQDRWIRDKAGHGRKHARRQRPYSEKESYKWEAETARCAERLGDDIARTVVVNDRESDVYEYLQFMVHHSYRFVVRTQANRRLSSTEECIFSHLSECPVLGRTDVKIPGKGGRKGRTAHVTLRADHVSLKPPNRTVGQEKLEEINLWAVRVQEEDPPDGTEGICWVLWTSESAQTLSEALEVQRLYSLRWRIEEYFKAWKSGCGVEQLRMPYRDNLLRMAVILAFVAVRLLQSLLIT